MPKNVTILFTLTLLSTIGATSSFVFDFTPPPGVTILTEQVLT